MRAVLLRMTAQMASTAAANNQNDGVSKDTSAQILREKFSAFAVQVKRVRHHRAVRFEGWQNTREGDRDVQQALRKGATVAQVFDAPPSFLDFLKWMCVADGDKARRVMGFAPRHDIRAVLRPAGSAGATEAARAAEASAAPAGPPVEELLEQARHQGYQDGYRNGLSALETYKQTQGAQLAAHMSDQVAGLVSDLHRRLDIAAQHIAFESHDRQRRF